MVRVIAGVKQKLMKNLMTGDDYSYNEIRKEKFLNERWAAKQIENFISVKNAVSE